ncbi:MAG: hypothetical protein R3B70_26190 [Polyangiaceae bacterium]
MRWTIALSLAALSCALTAGCGGEKSSGSTAGAESKIGVAACDDYVAKVEACMSKMSASEKAAMQSFPSTREAWKKAAERGGPEKDQLQPACEAALVSLPPACK